MSCVNKCTVGLSTCCADVLADNSVINGVLVLILLAAVSVSVVVLEEGWLAVPGGAAVTVVEVNIFNGEFVARPLMFAVIDDVEVVVVLVPVSVSVIVLEGGWPAVPSGAAVTGEEANVFNGEVAAPPVTVAVIDEVEVVLRQLLRVVESVLVAVLAGGLLAVAVGVANVEDVNVVGVVLVRVVVSVSVLVVVLGGGWLAAAVGAAV